MDAVSPHPSKLERTVVGQLAPSPTGHLHLGHAFSLLVAWWHAKSQGGRVVLRLDDVDSERAEYGFVDQLLDDLSWLGLSWDGPPQLASEHTIDHERAVDRLWAQGEVYPCVCSRADVTRALGAPQAGAAETRYPGLCRGKFASRTDAERLTGKAAALRIIVPPGMRSFRDLIYGPYFEDMQSNVGDFVVQRRTGTSAYQLACVIDDDLEGVTHVVRGRDLLASTLRQNLIAERLGLAMPEYAHVPLICDHNGRRLAKRERDMSLLQLRAQGVSARQVVRWAARCAAQILHSDQSCAQDFVAGFDPLRILPHDIVLPSLLSAAWDESGSPVRYLEKPSAP
jgi:glutamyl-tRNA synthetase